MVAKIREVEKIDEDKDVTRSLYMFRVEYLYRILIQEIEIRSILMQLNNFDVQNLIEIAHEETKHLLTPTKTRYQVDVEDIVDSFFGFSREKAIPITFESILTVAKLYIFQKATQDLKRQINTFASEPVEEQKKLEEKRNLLLAEQNQVAMKLPDTFNAEAAAYPIEVDHALEAFLKAPNSLQSCCRATCAYCPYRHHMKPVALSSELVPSSVKDLPGYYQVVEIVKDLFPNRAFLFPKSGKQQEKILMELKRRLLNEFGFKTKSN